MAQKEISRREALRILDCGGNIMIAVKVKRPYQIGLRPGDNNEDYVPLFLAGDLEWVEEPNRFVICSREELLAVVYALKGVDAEYCSFFDNRFGAAGLVDISVYPSKGNGRAPSNRTIDLSFDPYNWRMPVGGEWTRVGRNRHYDDSI